MILTINIGNTNISCAVFAGKKIIYRFKTPTKSTKDLQSAKRLFLKNLGKKRLEKITGVCVGSVVPGLNAKFKRTCKKIFGISPLFATPENIGIRLKKYTPKEIGVDRLLNSAAAFNLYKRALIVIDAGTGITFDVVNGMGEYLGGAIAPGVGMSAKALNLLTAKLPLVQIFKPRGAIGASTRECIRSGIYFGTVGTIEMVLKKIKDELKIIPLVIATGGDAKLIARGTKLIRKIHPDLIHLGLKNICNN